MLIKFIDKSGNFSMLETLTEPNYEKRLEKIGNVWFEKRNVVEPKIEKKVVKVEEPKVEEKVEVKEEIKEEVEVNMDEQYKAFLKEKKVRWYALLKGEWLKNKALAEGFILN